MQKTATVSWNNLFLGQPSSAPTVFPEVTQTALKQVDCETGSVDVARTIQLNDWELEAVRRYRALQKIQENSSYLQCEYMFSSAMSGALLQLIMQLKLLPVTDWRDCARGLARQFQGCGRAPLKLLSYAVTQLVTTHQLTPLSAVKFLLDISRALLAEAATPGQSHIVSVEDWDTAEELGRSVYALQVTGGHSLFENFSSLFLDALLGDVIDNADNSQLWRLLPFCFLVRRNKDFALPTWESDKNAHCVRLRRACDSGHVFPTHITSVLSAVM